MENREIAAAFSNGHFELTYLHLAEDIEWIVVGEKYLKGRANVIEDCEQTSGYFKSVVTDFKTINIISDNNRVAVNGTGEFFRNGKRVSFVYACDVYEFNKRNELKKITSYCIPDKS